MCKLQTESKKSPPSYNTKLYIYLPKTQIYKNYFHFSKKDWNKYWKTFYKEPSAYVPTIMGLRSSSGLVEPQFIKWSVESYTMVHSKQTIISIMKQCVGGLPERHIFLHLFRKLTINSFYSIFIAISSSLRILQDTVFIEVLYAWLYPSTSYIVGTIGGNQFSEIK